METDTRRRLGGSVLVAVLAISGPYAGCGEVTPPGSAPVKIITYSDLVCGKLPAVPASFSVPAEYLSRAPGTSLDAGCLWGTRADLDKVTAATGQGDFSSIEHGVLWARPSTNVVCDPRTGAFDEMDGSGEAGICSTPSTPTASEALASLRCRRGRSSNRASAARRVGDG